MIKLRPWKETKNEFEVDIIVNGPSGRTLRKRVKAPVTGRSNAERWAKSVEQDLLARLLAPEPEPEKPPAPTFEEFAVTFLGLCKSNRLGVNTLTNYEVHLRLYLVPVLGKRRLDEVKPTDITKVKDLLTAKSHNTTCEVLKTLRCVFNAAIKEKVLKHVPVEFDIPARLHKAPVAYDDAEQAALLAAAEALGPSYVAMVLLGIDGGLRRGEILGLKWSDINIKRATITIRHNVVRGKLDIPKGRTEEDIGMTKRLGEALAAARHQRGPFVFSTDAGEHYKDHNIKRWMEQLVKAGKIPWRATHVLRKTCGTRIADGGGGVAAIATHLRHKDLKTANRYIDRSGASTRAINALES